MTLTAEEVRALTIELLTEETDRDRQTRVGASDLSDQCDRSLAYALLGETNRSSVTDRYWLGRVIGSSVGALLESRAITRPELSPERHVWFGDIPGYGCVGGSIDLLVDRTIVDFKGAWRKDIALIEDYLQRQGVHRVGEKPRYEQQARGNYKFNVATDQVLTMSANAYEHALKKVEYKVDRYVGQVSLYALSGVADYCVLQFFARDGNAGYDNPGLEGYADPRRKHDLFPWGFEPDLDYARFLLDRAARIWAQLQDGATPSDFEAHPLCFACEKAGEADVMADVFAIFEEAA